MSTMDKKIILVVEDETPLLDAVKIKLEKYEFSAVTARTVDQALGYLKDLPKVDAIWLDHYLLGSESGLDFIAKIKEGESSWHKIPIFVVSNTASPDKVQSYLELGVKKYYIKAEVRLENIIDHIRATLANPEE